MSFNAEEREVQGLCVAILELAMKDYASQPSGSITCFVKSPLCELYCNLAEIHPVYYREMFKSLQNKVKK